jgi:hypothetical protein
MGLGSFGKRLVLSGQLVAAKGAPGKREPLITVYRTIKNALAVCGLFSIRYGL